MNPIYSPITKMLNQYQNGQLQNFQTILWATYAELARIGHNLMRSERSSHTLQTQALVHEAYLRVMDLRQVHWRNREHFFATWSATMRRVLVDYARARNAGKRAHRDESVALLDDLCGNSEDAEIIALHQALDALAAFDPLLSKIVELRYFGGLSVEETADVMGVSPATIKRKWALAKAWLYRELSNKGYDA